MKIYSILAAITLIIGVSSCSPSDPIYDNTVDEWQILGATDATPSALSLIHQPDGKIMSLDIFANANNGIQLPGKINKIIEFRDNLYLLIPSVFKIVVVNTITFKQVAVVDLSAKQLIPSDIAFVNATTGYIAHENDTTVSVIDITNFVVARSITVGNHPIAIAAVGNQVFVANQLSNTVSQIDTRTNAVVATHFVAVAPTFIRPVSNGHEVVVLSLGAGKIDSAVKTAPVATFIDSARIIMQATPLTSELFDIINESPTSMVVSLKDWVFITVQKGLIRLDGQGRKDASLVLEGQFSRVFHNYRRSELLLLNGTNGIITDDVEVKQRGTFSTPSEATSLVGL